MSLIKENLILGLAEGFSSFGYVKNLQWVSNYPSKILRISVKYIGYTWNEFDEDSRIENSCTKLVWTFHKSNCKDKPGSRNCHSVDSVYSGYLRKYFVQETWVYEIM